MVRHSDEFYESMLEAGRKPNVLQLAVYYVVLPHPKWCCAMLLHGPVSPRLPEARMLQKSSEFRQVWLEFTAVCGAAVTRAGLERLMHGQHAHGHDGHAHNILQPVSSAVKSISRTECSAG